MWKKSDNKKTPQELQEYLAFRRRGHKVNNKTKYNRKKKHKLKQEDEN